MRRRYAVVDLEATSASSNAKIIQVGIVIIEGGEIVSQYATDINPHQKLDQHIIDLTGLTDQRLAQAPDFNQVAKEIFELIQDAIFVAHNVKFDANLLAEELFWAGYELKSPRIDTVELAQVFFPSLERYGLSQLSQELGLDLEQAHTAIADAYATAQLFLLLEKKMASLPQALLARLYSLSEHLLYESSLLFEDILEHSSFSLQPDLHEVEGLYLKKSFFYKKEKALSQNFEHNLHFLGLVPRENQALFAQEIAEALKQPEASFIEGETGLGKTYAYLLTLLAKSQKQICVSLPTKLLQDQVYDSEGKRISQLFHINIQKLKSPRSYLDLEAFHQLLTADLGNRLWERAKMQILVWLTETETGDLDELGQAYRFEAFLDKIRHDKQPSKRSLFYEWDFWLRNQEGAKGSRILLVNHAYLLQRLTDNPKFLAGKILLVDEAQKLFSSLEGISHHSLSMLSLYRQLMDEKNQASQVLEQRLLESIQFHLQSLEEDFRLTKERDIDLSALAPLKRDLDELPNHYLIELRLALKDCDQAWFKREELSERDQLLLETAKLELMNFASLLPEECQVVMVSATLDISKRVNLASLLGFTNWKMVQISRKKKDNQLLVIDQAMPDISQISSSQFTRLLCQRIEDLAELQKPILVLFNSKDLLLEVSQELNLPHLAQYKNGTPSNIKRRFDRGESQILLGSAAFWEGTDFLKQDQMIQIISRIPFDNPKDPFVQKVNSHLRKEKKNPFYDYSLPLAILRLKQALGRTRRREDQYSAAVFMDSRLISKSYGRQIRESLKKEGQLLTLDSQEIKEEILAFFEKKETNHSKK